MWGNDRVQMIACHCTINSRSSAAGRVIASREIIGTSQIAAGLLRELKNFLAVVNKLLRTIRVIERDKIGKRAQICVRERFQILRDLDLKLEQQSREFVIKVVLDGATVGMDNRCPETGHHIKRVIGECDRLFIARNAAAVEGVVIEKAIVAADALSYECVGVEKLRIIARERMTDY